MVIATAERKRKSRTDRGSIVIGGNVRIPPGITSFEAFRSWTRSKHFPNQGDIDWLGGLLWVDLAMEQLYTHGVVKLEISAVLTGLAKQEKTGVVFPDGVRLNNPEAELSVEPDALFISFESLDKGIVREVPGSEGGFIELLGSPDMVLEVVSDSSIDKDTDELMDLYFLAGVKEYWLVDVRGQAVEFDIYKRGPKGFVATRRQRGKLRSIVFGKEFQLTRDVDRRGNPLFTLAVS